MKEGKEKYGTRISGGIEKFAAVAMPTLFVMVIIVVIRSITLEILLCR